MNTRDHKTEQIIENFRLTDEDADDRDRFDKGFVQTETVDDYVD